MDNREKIYEITEILREMLSHIRTIVDMLDKISDDEIQKQQQ